MKLKYTIIFCSLLISGLAWSQQHFAFTSAPHIDSLKVISRDKDLIKFQVTAPHSMIAVKTAPPLDVADIPVLSFTLETTVQGKVTLFYTSSDGALISIDTRITIIPGKNEYEIDLGKQTCGREYKSKNIPNYRQFGAADKKISGLRIDLWFPNKTIVSLSDLKLGKLQTDKEKK